MGEVRRTERGWPGHFVDARNCVFHRNTLVECGDEMVIVSTVGNYRGWDGRQLTLGPNRWYETMVFRAGEIDGYIDIIDSQPVGFKSKWAICSERWEDLRCDVDTEANEMHEAVVEEMVAMVQARKRPRRS